MANPWDNDPMVTPHSFKDANYDQFDTISAQKAGIPVDLLKNIRTQGEKSNADQVSSKGARTVYQIIPATRDAILKKYGVDAYKGGQEASLAAAHLLKESLDRHGGDQAMAAREYHGGVDQSQWGKKTQKYAGRVVGNTQQMPWENDPLVQQPATRQTDLAHVPSPTIFGQGGGRQTQVPGRETQLGQPEAWTPYVADRIRQGLLQGTVGQVVGGISSVPQAFQQAAATRQRVEDIRGKSALSYLFEAPARSFEKAAIGITPQQAQAFSEAGANAIEQAGKYLGVKNVPIPRDSTGKPSKGAEYLGQFAYLAGASILPGGRAIALAPNKALAAMVEAASIAASSEGGITLREGFEQNADRLGMSKKEAGQLGETIGTMLGPNLIMAVATKAQKAGQFAGNKFNIPGLRTATPEQAAHSAVTQEVQKGLQYHPASASNIQEAARLRAEMPGFEPNIARASDAPSLKATYHSMMSGSPEYLARGAEEESRLNAAISGYQNAQFPGGKVPVAEQLQNRVGQIDRRLRQIAGKTQEIGQAPIGDQVRQLLGEKEKAVRDVATSKYRAAYAEAAKANLRPSTGEIYNSAVRTAGDDAKFWQDKSPVLYQILSKYAPQKVGAGTAVPRISFEEWHSLYKRLGDEIGRAEARGNTGLAQSLRPVQQSMYGMVKQFEDTTKYGNVAATFRDANRYFQSEVIPNFVEGLGGRIKNTNKFGEVTPNEKIVSKLIANPTGIEQYFNAFGNDPRARKALTDGVYDMFAAKAIKNGEVDPAAANAFLKKNKEWLDKVPDIQKTLQSSASRSQALLARRAEIVGQQKQLDSRTLSQYFKDENISQKIAGALNNPVQLQGLVNNVRRNSEAAQSMAREIATHLSQRPDMEAYLPQHEAQLKPLMDSLGPKHWENLKNIASAKQVVGRVRTPTTVTPPEEKGIFEKTLGVPAQSLLNRFFGRIQPGETYRDVYLAGKFVMKLNRENVEKAREAAFFNPDVAQVLADIQSKGATPYRLNSLKNHLLAHGVRILSARTDTQAKREEERQ